MTEQEYIRKQAECGEKRFVVSRSGKFYCAYGCGAFALSRATGYRVMRRQRKGGNHVLTAGFPESRLNAVLELIVAHGGVIEQQSEEGFLFSGLDGSEDATLVFEQKPTGTCKESELRRAILSFDLSRSTPMEAMLFIDRLQRQLGIS